ncbi:nuclear transport factor 2 family protein [Streptomyces xanthophaeus]|uniref:nuclear transport factor 2 family protein n=1 Tax=Streptomyces xanthophaeus TaxID=67385 RepID=UPI0036988AA2
MIDEYLASRQALQDLREMNALFIENFVRNDVPSHDSLLHREFITIQSDGSKVDRATYLERWANGFDPDIIRYWDVRDEDIVIVGNCALVRSTNKYIMRRGGQEVTGMAAYTDTYVYEDGAWQCIQAQITPVEAGHYPSDETIIAIYIAGVKQNRRASAHGPSCS